MITFGVVFTVHSNYENERPAVCLKLNFETNFWELELFLHKEWIFVTKFKN